MAHLTPRDYQTYGVLREREALSAMSSLGVPAGALTFLGFPDEGLCELASTYLSAKIQAFKSPYTGRISPPLTLRMVRPAMIILLGGVRVVRPVHRPDPTRRTGHGTTAGRLTPARC